VNQTFLPENTQGFPQRAATGSQSFFTFPVGRPFVSRATSSRKYGALDLIDNIVDQAEVFFSF
jgi:hypothetical protein